MDRRCGAQRKKLWRAGDSMAPPHTHIIEVEADSADPRVLRLVPGTVMNPLTVGRRGMWRVEASDVLDLHVHLYFDGRSLFVQSAKESWPAIVEGSEMPCRWVAVSAPCRITIGGATLHFRVLGESHVEDHTEATVVASRSPAENLLPPPAPTGRAPAAGDNEPTAVETYRDEERTQVEARPPRAGTLGYGAPASSAPPTAPNATTLRMDHAPDSARTIARAQPGPESARTIARAQPAPEPIARPQTPSESARTVARATPPVAPPPQQAPASVPPPAAAKPKPAPSGRDVSREAGAAAAGASLGTVLADKYRVDRVIGRGGMSYVIEGTHVQLGQKVAIKLLRRALAEAPDAYDRALAEARAAAQITSEHAAKVFDIGSLDDGAPFIVMELLNGIDLRTRIQKNGTVTPEEAVEYVLQACDALAEAHGRGVVHRDLKPANLFLTKRPDGSPMIKVLDFGLAKLEGLADRAALRGSPGYASPEQLQPGRNVDGRADVWALGVILFELVSGKLPFDAPKLTEMLAATTERPPHPLTSPRGPLPPTYERIVLRCLSPDPDRG
jgi:serine/threonine-protein kinase